MLSFALPSEKSSSLPGLSLRSSALCLDLRRCPFYALNTLKAVFISELLPHIKNHQEPCPLKQAVLRRQLETLTRLLWLEREQTGGLLSLTASVVWNSSVTRRVCLL